MKYKVGDRVSHSGTFKWGSQGGTSDGIIKEVCGSGLPYVVAWDNGETNSYNESDLSPAKGALSYTGGHFISLSRASRRRAILGRLTIE